MFTSVMMVFAGSDLFGDVHEIARDRDRPWLFIMNCLVTGCLTVRLFCCVTLTGFLWQHLNQFTSLLNADQTKPSEDDTGVQTVSKSILINADSCSES